MKKVLVIVCFLLVSGFGFAQRKSLLPAEKWVDSIFATLSADEKIGQLMVVRSSGLKDGSTVFYDQEVMTAIKKFNIGGICLFQGGAVQHALRINAMQSAAKTPLLVTVDAEWGLGMRFDSVLSLPRQMMMAAVDNAGIMYDYGKIVAAQCRRMGIQVNYAPVVDINNNPDNPVINDRSFGEDKFRVASFGVQYMKGLQENGVMACAKHFPGHGDVAVDSHKDLPVILKTRTELDALELYPFREMFRAGVASVMIAHLSIPAIDSTENLPTSLSKKNIDGLLRRELNFNGLSFTDALEMQGVAKYYPDGEGSVQSLIAGNDMLCLPGDIPGSILRIKKAIKKKKLSWPDIDARVKKVLLAKYQYGLANWSPVNLQHLAEDLNKDIPAFRQRAAEQGITMLRNSNSTLPLAPGGARRVAYIGLGLNKDNRFAARMRSDYNAHTYYFDYGMDSAKANALLALIQNRYDLVITAFHNYNRRPANNFGISNAAVYLANAISSRQKSVTVFFGNPYAVKNNCEAGALLAAYEDDDIFQEAAADLINGKFRSKGKVPVKVCDLFPYGSGIVQQRILPDAWPADVALNYKKLQQIDSICENAIVEKAIPGCVVLVAKDGKIAFERSYGKYAYTDSTPVYCETIYDLASVTKIMATTLSIMKLYDEGKLQLNKTLGDYLPFTKQTNKAALVIKDILLHEAGLKDFIPFYKETIDADGIPNSTIYANKPDSLHSIRVAENLYLRNDYTDTIYKRILQSGLTEHGKYVYSDNDFIFLGKVVEAISGKPLDVYVQETFYTPLSLNNTGFRPLLKFPKTYMAPTEYEPVFRRQLMQGDVHDPGAAMFGGVAGHAGLFSNAYDLAVLSQLLLNRGTINGLSFFKPTTVDLFTAYNSAESRRGLGFDKPEKDNRTRTTPYPSRSVSAATFGHTGFTGTCIWIDPVRQLTYIFLSNRVNNNGDAGRFSKMNVRPNIQELIYGALEDKQ
jgi:beta-N-acetylhexosaminidase